MNNKIALVTGASSGIGLETALALARQGIFTVMLCRNRARGEAALEYVKNQAGNNAALMLCDLADMAEIRRFCGEFSRIYNRLDILVNNAGVLSFKRRETIDGLELHFGVCHIGHFLLTNLLLPKMTSGSRIVMVGSAAHKAGRFDFGDAGMKKRYNIAKAYSRAKLCNMLFTTELARRLDGSGITVNCVHPGAVMTNIAAGKRGSKIGVSVFRKVMGMILKPFVKTAANGAATSVYVATSAEVQDINGGYFADCAPASPSKLSCDAELAERLWSFSEGITDVKFNFKH